MADLKKALKEKAEPTPPAKVDPIAALINKQNKEIMRALPAHLDAGHFARVITTAIKTTPDLAKCTRESLASAIMLSAQLGLEPGTFGHCYLIPYNNRHTQSLECQFQIGYRGYLELVHRSGGVKSVNAECVHEEDTFSITLGTDYDIEHQPYLDGDRGKIKLVYAVAHLTNGGVQFCWMSKSDIDKHRSKHSKARKSPWDTDWAEMAKKTVVKRLCKMLPMSVDLHRKLDQDGKIKRAIAPEMLDAQPGEDDAVEAEYEMADSNADDAPSEGAA